MRRRTDMSGVLPLCALSDLQLIEMLDGARR